MIQRIYGTYYFSKEWYIHIETVRFLTIMLKNDFKTIPSQEIGKQRMFIDPKVFIDIYECFIDELYSKFWEFSKFENM